MKKYKTIEKIEYWECERCSRNTLEDTKLGYCPCPRGSCEAEHVGTITITTKVEKDKIKN